MRPRLAEGRCDHERRDAFQCALRLQSFAADVMSLFMPHLGESCRIQVHSREEYARELLWALTVASLPAATCRRGRHRCPLAIHSHGLPRRRQREHLERSCCEGEECFGDCCDAFDERASVAASHLLVLCTLMQQARDRALRRLACKGGLAKRHENPGTL